jgi:hypothetical protein
LQGKEDAAMKANGAMRCAALVFVLATARLQAQFSNQSSVVDGFGGWCSNATYRCVVAAAQPCPVGTGENGGNLNCSGFLQTFLMQPLLDTDGDGIPNENDPDNDNDGIADATELDGSAFSFAVNTPTDVNLADTDGDGTPDGAEAAARSNPQDPDSRLTITSVEKAGSVTLTWHAQGGSQYRLLSGTDLLESLPTNPVPASAATATGGSAPWYDTSATKTVASPGAGPVYYRVERTGP